MSSAPAFQVSESMNWIRSQSPSAKLGIGVGVIALSTLVMRLVSRFSARRGQAAARHVETWESHVHPHEELEQLTRDLLRVEGTLPKMAFSRNMVAWRLPTAEGPHTGDVVIHSAICLDEARMASFIEWAGGESRVRYIIAPNSWHRADCAQWKQRFPHARVLTPADTVDSVRELEPSVEPIADPDKEDVPSFLTEAGVEVFSPCPGRYAGYVFLVPVDSTRAQMDGEGKRAVVFSDLLFNVPKLPSGVMGFISNTVLRSSAGHLAMGNIGRLFTRGKTRTNVIALLHRLADDERVEWVVPGHGTVIEGHEACRKALLRAADEL